jgi:hypothetical protein
MHEIYAFSSLFMTQRVIELSGHLPQSQQSSLGKKQSVSSLSVLLLRSQTVMPSSPFPLATSRNTDYTSL